ncbi:MAG: AtpZ/AtpI family protein [Phenylobacterium sp.]
MVDSDQAMPQPDDRPDEAFNRLTEDLKAFEAARARPATFQASRSIGEGYRLLAELLGGVLGGVGLGWFVDRVAHTAPWGTVVGVTVGAGLSVYLAASTAFRMGRKALEKDPPKAVPFDDDED